MPEDVGGTPFPDGWEPDDDHDRGVSDEEFASVVLDEAFVRAAVIHEPTAVERLLAAAQARAEASEAESRRAHATGERYGTDFGHSHEFDPFDDADDFERRHGFPGAYGRQVRWHRPVAWMLAVVMGVGMVALAFVAVYHGDPSGNDREQAPPPASTGPEQGGAAVPPASADPAQPPVPAVPHTP
ncbi:SCO2584 family spore wall biosynthesis protein [Streptomyces sp. NPDC003697]